MPKLWAYNVEWWAFEALSVYAHLLCIYIRIYRGQNAVGLLAGPLTIALSLSLLSRSGGGWCCWARGSSIRIPRISVYGPRYCHVHLASVYTLSLAALPPPPGYELIDSPYSLSPLSWRYSMALSCPGEIRLVTGRRALWPRERVVCATREARLALYTHTHIFLFMRQNGREPHLCILSAYTIYTCSISAALTLYIDILFNYLTMRERPTNSNNNNRFTYDPIVHFPILYARTWSYLCCALSDGIGYICAH